MVKWQNIVKYGGGSTLGLFVLLAGILNMTGMEYSVSEDQYCIDCFDIIYVNSSVLEIKVEHAGDKDVVFAKRMASRTKWINLDKIDEFITTEPKIPIEILVPTIKRYATMNHPKYGYLRPIKDGDSLIERKNKNNPDGNWFVIHGETGGQSVKWGLSLKNWLTKDIEIDPLWLPEEGIMKDGVVVKPVCDYETTFWNEKVYVPCTKNYTVTDCSDPPTNKTCKDTVIFYNSTCYNHTIQKNKSICNEIGLQVGDNKLVYAKNGYCGCFTKGTEGVCIYSGQGACIDRTNNHNRLFSGEEGDEFDFTNTSIILTKTKPIPEKGKEMIVNIVGVT